METITEQIDTLRISFNSALENNESTDNIMSQLDLMLKDKFDNLMDNYSDDSSESDDDDSLGSEDDESELIYPLQSNTMIEKFMESLKTSKINNSLSDEELFREIKKITGEK